MKIMEYKGRECQVVRTIYVANGNLALALLDKTSGELVATITTNVGDNFPKNIAAVKDYSEKSGMLEALKNAGLVKKVLNTVRSGFVEIPIVLFDLEEVEELQV